MVIAPTWFNRLLRSTVGAYLGRRYRLRGVGLHHLKKVPPPYIVVPNHVNFWDPVLLSLFFSRPVYFVAADGNFRSRLMRRLLTLLGAIPKAKAKRDTATVRAMVDLLKRGEIVGVFAEGQRTWDGESKEPMPATAKLLRLLKTTVVVPHLRGAYLSLPRWSPFRRKGKLEIAFSPARILPGHLLATMSVYEIDRWLRGALEFSETAWQQKERIPFPSRRRAEYLETLLYLCPSCGQALSLESRGATVRCTACGLESNMDRYGELRGPFSSVADWNLWQQEELRRKLLLWLQTPGEDAFTSLSSLTLHTGKGSRPLLEHGEVSISLKREGLELTVRRLRGKSPLLPESGSWTVPYAEIHGVHVQLRQDLEFYRGSILHVLRPVSERACTHLFELAIVELQKAIFTG